MLSGERAGLRREPRVGLDGRQGPVERRQRVALAQHPALEALDEAPGKPSPGRQRADGHADISQIERAAGEVLVVRAAGAGGEAVNLLAETVIARRMIAQYHTLRANTPSVRLGASLGFVPFAETLAVRL